MPSIYCPAKQEWLWHNILFTSAKLNINSHTSLEQTRIDTSFVY